MNFKINYYLYNYRTLTDWCQICKGPVSQVPKIVHTSKEDKTKTKKDIGMSAEGSR